MVSMIVFTSYSFYDLDVYTPIDQIIFRCGPLFELSFFLVRSRGCVGIHDFARLDAAISILVTLLVQMIEK